MTRFRHLYRSLIWIGLCFTMIPVGGAPFASAAEQAQQSRGESARPEVGKPLQAAQELLKAQKYKEALAKVHEAESAKDKTPYETYLIERMRGAVAAATGDTEVAIKSFETAIASGRLSPSEQLKMVQAAAGMHYRAKDYAKAAVWASRYLKEGGTDAQMRTLLIQSYYLNNDCPNVAKELQSEFQAAETAGRAPPEEWLQLLASCYVKHNDNAGYAAALEKLVTYYPKKAYWADLIHRVETKPGFANRLDLDVYRLKLALGILRTATEFMEMTQLALQAGFPAEAKKIIDQGFAAGVLGSGSDADRQKRLRNLAARNAADDQKTLAQSEAEAVAAKDGTGLVNVGFAYVGNDQFDKGIALMEQGIRKGGLKRPEDAKLRLGIAYLLAGQKAKAVQMLKTVQGADGTGDLARLWIIHSHHSS